MKKTILLFAVHSILVIAFAQNPYKDSLTTFITQLEKQPVSINRDTSLTKALNLLAREYAYSLPDSAIYFTTKALNYAKKTKWEVGMGISYHQMGIFAGNKGDYIASLKYFEQALTIWSKHEKSADKLLRENALKRKPKTLSSIGVLYDNTGDYVKSIENYLKALKYQEAGGDKKGQATTFGNIGLVYFNLKEHKTALEFYNKAIVIDTELKNYEGLGRHFGNMAMSFDEQKIYDKALNFNFKALKRKIQQPIRCCIYIWKHRKYLCKYG